VIRTWPRLADTRQSALNPAVRELSKAHHFWRKIEKSVHVSIADWKVVFGTFELERLHFVLASTFRDPRSRVWWDRPQSLWFKSWPSADSENRSQFSFRADVDFGGPLVLTLTFTSGQRQDPRRRRLGGAPTQSMEFTGLYPTCRTSWIGLTLKDALVRRNRYPQFLAVTALRFHNVQVSSRQSARWHAVKSIHMEDFKSNYFSYPKNRYKWGGIWHWSSTEIYHRVILT